MKSTWRGCLCSCYLRDPSGGSGSAHEPSAALTTPGPPRSAQRSPGPGAAGPGGAGRWSRGSGVPGRAVPGRAEPGGAGPAGPCPSGPGRAREDAPEAGGCPQGSRVASGRENCARISLTPCARCNPPKPKGQVSAVSHHNGRCERHVSRCK